MAFKIFLLSFLTLVAVQSFAAPMVSKRALSSFFSSSVYTDGNLISIKTFDVSFTEPPNDGSASTGAGAGKATPSTLTITFAPNKAFDFAVGSGTIAQKAEIIERKGADGTTKSFVKYVFHDCELVSYELQGASGVLVATAEIKFLSYSIAYSSQKPDASTGVPSGWDVTTNVSDPPIVPIVS